MSCANAAKDVVAQCLKLFAPKQVEYRRMLRNLVDVGSYTGDPVGVRKQAHCTVEAFASLPRPMLAHFVESQQDRHGPHLVLTSSETATTSSTVTPLDKIVSSNTRNHKQEQQRVNVGLISHLDTVFPDQQLLDTQFCWVDESETTDRVIGPGTMDIKGGTLVIYMILEALQTLYPRVYAAVDFNVLLNAAEEEMATDFFGVAQRFLGEPEKNLGCLIFEAGVLHHQHQQQYHHTNETDDDDSVVKIAKVVTARKGRCVWNITSKGIDGHAGNAHATSRNAIVQLADVVSAISQLTDYDRSVTVNVGTFNGGTGANVVPSHAETVVEIRAADPTSFVETIERVEAICELHPHITTHTLQHIPVWMHNERSNQLLRVYQTACDQLGYTAVSEARGGGSDGNWLWERYATLDGLGPSGYNAHSCDLREPTTTTSSSSSTSPPTPATAPTPTPTPTSPTPATTTTAPTPTPTTTTMPINSVAPPTPTTTTPTATTPTTATTMTTPPHHAETREYAEWSSFSVKAAIATATIVQLVGERVHSSL